LKAFEVYAKTLLHLKAVHMPTYIKDNSPRKSYRI